MAQRDDSVAATRARSSKGDPLAPEQVLLLRAAEQLQDAIKSTRKYRTSSALASSPQLQSPVHDKRRRSDHYTGIHASRCGTDRVVGVDDPYNGEDEEDDKENTRCNELRAVSHQPVASIDRSVSKAITSAKALPSRERLSSHQTTQSLSDDLLFDLSHLSDDSAVSGASPTVHDSSNSREASRYTVSEWERRGILRMSELSLSRMSQSDCDPLESHCADRRDVDTSIHAMTHRALVWMQQDTEKQAKATRAMHELLHGVVLILNDVFTDLMPRQDSDSSSDAAPTTHMKDASHWSDLSIERVDALVSEWERALLTWRRAADARSFQRQTQEQVCALERTNLDLKAQLKGAELCYLHWQAAYADQVTQTHLVTEQLGMALEETAVVQTRLYETQRQLAKTISVNALRLYQQKIAVLEAHVRDMQAQIACDHEEFAYEQQKWRLERKHLGQDVQEIQDVSVKVLKVVLIREKFLKQQEQRLAARTRAVDAQQQHAQQQCTAAQSVTRELMHETALLLVALQEWKTKTSRDGAVPVKPAVLKKMLKRLRRIDAAVASIQVREDEGGGGEETEAMHARIITTDSGEDRE